MDAMPYRPLYALVEAADERGRLYEEWTTLLQWYGAEYADRLAGRLIGLGCRDVRASPYGDDAEPILALPIGEWRVTSARESTSRDEPPDDARG